MQVVICKQALSENLSGKLAQGRVVDVLLCKNQTANPTIA
jgi:hypothetical protein